LIRAASASYNLNKNKEIHHNTKIITNRKFKTSTIFNHIQTKIYLNKEKRIITFRPNPIKIIIKIINIKPSKMIIAIMIILIMQIAILTTIIII